MAAALPKAPHRPLVAWTACAPQMSRAPRPPRDLAHACSKAPMVGPWTSKDQVSAIANRQALKFLDPRLRPLKLPRGLREQQISDARKAQSDHCTPESCCAVHRILTTCTLSCMSASGTRASATPANHCRGERYMCIVGDAFARLGEVWSTLQGVADSQAAPPDCPHDSTIFSDDPTGRRRPRSLPGRLTRPGPGALWRNAGKHLVWDLRYDIHRLLERPNDKNPRSSPKLPQKYVWAIRPSSFNNSSKLPKL